MKKFKIIVAFMVAATLITVFESCDGKREPGKTYMPDMAYSRAYETYSVTDSMREELAKRGIGVLAITHLLHFARETADRVMFMDAGEIIESGTGNVLIAPTQDRVRKFMSVMEYAT